MEREVWPLRVCEQLRCWREPLEATWACLEEPCGRYMFIGIQAKQAHTFPRQKAHIGAWDAIQSLQYMLSKHEDLGSVPRTT